MSANNYLTISRDERTGKYYGWDCDAEDDESGIKVFTADSIEDAVYKAQKYSEKNIVEYGYRFANLPKRHAA